MEEEQWEDFCAEIIKAKADVENLNFNDFIKIIDLFLECVKVNGLYILYWKFTKKDVRLELVV